MRDCKLVQCKAPSCGVEFPQLEAEKLLGDPVVGYVDFEDDPQAETRLVSIRYGNTMDDIEKIINEIEQLEQLLELPDKRPLRMPDWKAANQKHDAMYADDPWFRLWRRDGS